MATTATMATARLMNMMLVLVRRKAAAVVGCGKVGGRCVD